MKLVRKEPYSLVNTILNHHDMPTLHMMQSEAIRASFSVKLTFLGEVYSPIAHDALDITSVIVRTPNLRDV
jgi:hypothetical protein